MPSSNPLRRLARRTPSPLDGVVEYLLDLPGRVPLPAKITIQILPPIDLRERFGDSVDADAAYEQVTAEMQEALSELSEERTLPIVG
jgi:hypothetical protein